MKVDNIDLQINLKVEIGYLKLHMEQAEKSFVKTEQAHNSLIKNLSNSINTLVGLLEKLKES